MKRIILFALFNISLSPMYAQMKVDLYQGNPPGNLSEINKEVFVNNGRGRLDSVTIPDMTIFKPATQDVKRPAVLICPGGGYLNLSIFDGGYQVAQEMNKHGIVAIVLKYRTFINGFYKDYKSIPFMDLERAFDIVKDSANAWNINLVNIGIMGLSAGGHLASMKAVSTKGFKTAFNLLIYPVISFRDELTSPATKTRKTLLGNHPTDDEKNNFSSEMHVTNDTKPCFIVHAQDDSTVMVQNSLVFYKALIEHKVKAEILIYQHGGHGFALHNKAENSFWMPLAINWMKTNQFLTK